MAEGAVSPSLLFVCLVLLTARAQDDIRVPPQIIQPVVFAKKFYLPSATMVLMCNATGTPKPTYVWYRNRVEVQSSTRLGISLDAKTGVLKIKPFTVDREGVFQCRAKNTFPERVQPVAVSPRIEARVARISGWPGYRVEKVSKEFEEGDYGSITCADRYPTSIGSTRIVWYYRVQRRQRPLQPNERTYMASKGTVHFAYMLRSDQRSGAEYYCAVKNVARGSLFNAMKKTKLIIKQKYPVPESAPVLRFSTQSLGPEARTFKRNSVARLECFFSGYINSTKKADKVPTITWKDSDGNEITNVKGRYSIESYGRVLKIENLVETDEKSYTCTGVNKLGRAEGTIHINITSTPIWVKPLKSTTVVQGDSAIFYCQSRSAAKENPPSKPTWTMNGQPFSVVDPKKYAFADNSQALTVKSAQKSKDITCFQCYVSNSVGEEFGNGCLNVILPIRITTEPQIVQTVGMGDTVNLTVVAVSDRLFPVSYRWILRSKLYEGDQAPPHVFYYVSTGLAYINTNTLTDEEMLSIKGVYRREVFHQLQKVVVNVDVRIKTAQENGGSGKGDKKRAAAFTTVNFGLFAGLLLAITFFILLVGYIRCRKNGVKPAYTEIQQQRSVAQVPSAKFTNRRSSNRSRASVRPSSASVASSAIEDDLSSYATSDASEAMTSQSDALTGGESNILVESSAISFGPPNAQRMGTPAHSFGTPTAKR